jgi:hypothetical protein
VPEHAPGGESRYRPPSVAFVPRLLAAALAVLASAAALLSAAAAAASWRAPVPGPVLRGFDYSRATPFARGARRGADFAARRGDRVLAPCPGRITFAGSVPRFGPALSIRCGRLVATLLGVRATRRGRARRGGEVGRATGPVRLGARQAGRRLDYLDPLALIAAAHPRGTPVGAAPRGGGPRARSRPVAPRRPGVAPRAAAARLPWTAWAGLGLLAAGAPAGALVRGRARRGHRAGVAVGHR